jgi:hypothetical protein
MVLETERDRLPDRRARGEALLSRLDAQIEATSRRKDSEAKRRKLKYLRWRRKVVSEAYAER